MTVKVFVFNAFFENTLVVYEGTDAVIVDPGCYDDREFDALLAFINAEHLKVHAILNTHCHIDHVLGNSRLKRKLNLPLWIPEKEKENFKSVEVYAPMYGIQHYEAADADHWMAEGEELNFGQLAFKILEVPGHSPGHQVFYQDEEHLLIGGDVLFQGSIGRTDLPGGNHDLLLGQIQSKLYVLPDKTVVYPGHGPDTTIGHEKAHNPFVRG